MKIIMTKQEIMKSLEIAKAYDEAAYDEAFSETHILYNEEEFKKACEQYNEETEGALTMNLIDGSIHIEMDEEVYCESIDFFVYKFKPLFTLMRAIVEFCESIGEEVEDFFSGIVERRKLARLEIENAELKAKIKANTNGNHKRRRRNNGGKGNGKPKEKKTAYAEMGELLEDKD